METFHRDVENFKHSWPEVRYLDLIFPDLNAIPRGKRIAIEDAAKLGQGVYMPISNNSLNLQGAVVESAGLGQHSGERDHLCFPIAGTLRPSANPEVGQVMLTMLAEDGQSPCQFQARNRLGELVERLKARNKFPVIALELEFYLVDPSRDERGALQPPINPAHHQREAFCDIHRIDNLDDYAEFLRDLNEAAQQQGLNTSGAVAEAAPGQFEINFHHQGDVLAACDQVIYAKRLIKKVAHQHGFEATFMAKPYSHEAGSGMHLHTSVLDSEGNNRFSKANGEASAEFYASLNALLAMMPESMALLCPNINAYRRFSAEHLAPTHANWGENHRGVALRIPNSNSTNRRIEHRIAGADVNPYLLVTVVLAGLLHAEEYGAQHCPEPLSTAAAALPLRMSDALALLAKGDAFYPTLGPEFLALFLACKQSELAEFEHTVTSLEVDWMLHSA
ncbi:glutamine synthetase family protein [Ferrimonas marina]|uniref:Gamma-glutamylputrescine synthase n=1 Tax=Ferrimonas marina TaxID=299255 RepID=A0A1M5YSZ6_9GAMM|nr:glutamine synthetase family protein [Ferrimonas marina]SHI14673.1 gamma-glutamylputrescine synthase [Ferrimonas marina]